VENNMATKTKKGKKVAAKKNAPKKKLDGKALAAKRKNRDSIAQYIKDQVAAGRTDVDAILESAKKEFPGKKPTRGYVRWIAKHQMGKELGKAKIASKAPAKKAASKKKASAKTSAPATPAPKADDMGSQPAVDPAS
jgi:hypothetical protein